MLRSLKSFLQDRAGNVMIMFAGMGIGLTLMVGAGVDYTRAVQFKSALQALADASVLAGASVYVSDATAASGIATAQAYWNNGLSRLPSNSGIGPVNFTTTSNAGGYYVHVTVGTSAQPSTIKTTFLSLVTSSIGAVVSATAKDPIVTATINLNGWTSDAGDGNSIYWYKVPQDDSIPAFNSTTTSDGTYNLIFSNVVTTPATLSASIAAAQQVGFAFVNQTAAHSPGWNYCNQYGGCTGSTHIFYSQLNNPNGANSSDVPAGSNGYGYSTTSGYAGGVVKNCSLEVQAYTSTAPTNPPSTGSCTTPATNPLFSPSCAQLNGQSVHYSWNDMGGGSDDYDYNDGQYNFNCSGGGGSTGVILTD